MKIQESAENYLETILMLGKEKGNVRSIDIATALSFFKAECQCRHEKPAGEWIYFDGQGRLYRIDRKGA
mgnify:CR=1 FL=1